MGTRFNQCFLNNILFKKFLFFEGVDCIIKEYKWGENVPYNELIKNFNTIRDYVRDFYVYGFDSREDYSKKSARTYDDAKRRVESYLSEYMQYNRDSSGKKVFISVDTRSTVHNPLFKAFKAKSFTDGDITLFFIIFDILHDSSVSLPLGEIVDIIDSEYLSLFDQPKVFDVSTVRKKLNEFVSFGMIKTEKRGKTLYYSRRESARFENGDALHFFSEAAPCGVIGSFMLDRIDAQKDILSFKHHYINSALDSEILCSLLDAMHAKQETEITKVTHKGKTHSMAVVPLRIFISVSNGRQYLLAYIRSARRIISFRIDYIIAVKPFAAAEDFDILREKLAGMQKYMWGVSTQGASARTETVEFTVVFGDDEKHIYQRLLREKRCGRVELLDEHNARFSAEVYDTNEMLTWIRTFICRITSISFSNKDIESQFISDIEAMHSIYLRQGVCRQENEDQCVERSDTESTDTPGNAAAMRQNRSTAADSVPESKGAGTPRLSGKPAACDTKLFSEIYGAYYNAVSRILGEAVDSPVNMDTIRFIAAEYAFSESVVAIETAIRSQSWQLILPDGTTPVRHKPDIPLTDLQLRWLKAISLDKRMRLFDCRFDLPDETEPLFTEDDFFVFDRYKDGDDYEDEAYIARFHMILSAIHSRTPLDVTITNKKGNIFTYTVMPEKLEYSEKDDKFRLLTSGSRTAAVINLGRITECTLHEGEFTAVNEKKRLGRNRTVTLELVDKRNALERVMLHFSHFEKTAEKLDGSRYRLTISYEQNDETEILIRVLSFGPLVQVTAPDRFIGMIRKRLSRQEKSFGEL